MATTQPLTTFEELEEMSTEAFLAWLLTSCKIDDEDYAPIRRDVQNFLLGELQEADFDVANLPSLRVPLYDWLIKGQP